MLFRQQTKLDKSLLSVAKNNGKQISGIKVVSNFQQSLF